MPVGNTALAVTEPAEEEPEEAPIGNDIDRARLDVARADADPEFEPAKVIERGGILEPDMEPDIEPEANVIESGGMLDPEAAETVPEPEG